MFFFGVLTVGVCSLPFYWGEEGCGEGFVKRFDDNLILVLVLDLFLLKIVIF